MNSKPGNAFGSRHVPATVRQPAVGARLFCAMLCVAALLGGCAAMSESECLNADWYAVGERDGHDGRPLAQLEKYYDACSRFGVYPDDNAYEDGREQGLAVYCTADNGYWEGRHGAGYRGVCPASLEPYFLNGYGAGMSVHRAAESVLRIDFGIEAARDEIGDLRREIDELESRDNADATEEEDESATDRLKEMYRRIGRLEAEIEGLQDDKVYAIVAYRRAVDVARSIGFYEDYEY